MHDYYDSCAAEGRKVGMCRLVQELSDEKEGVCDDLVGYPELVKRREGNRSWWWGYYEHSHQFNLKRKQVLEECMKELTPTFWDKLINFIKTK